MPRPAAEQEAVVSGRLSIQDVYQNARYDAGYRMGWRDAYRQARPARRKTRKKYEEYATGYEHGWEDQKTYHPWCPEWDEKHRGSGDPGCPGEPAP
jgi:hypothetical protein